jgi:hypothetical protein
MTTGSVMSSCSYEPSFFYNTRRLSQCSAEWSNHEGVSEPTYLPCDAEFSIGTDLKSSLFFFISCSDSLLSFNFRPLYLEFLQQPFIVWSIRFGRDRGGQRPPLCLPDLLLLYRVRSKNFVSIELASLLVLLFSPFLAFLHGSLEHCIQTRSVTIQTWIRQINIVLTFRELFTRTLQQAETLAAACRVTFVLEL